ncbi:TPA: hypothetical protein ACX6RO_001870 [Photobacterium damselae]
MKHNRFLIISAILATSMSISAQGSAFDQFDKDSNLANEWTNKTNIHNAVGMENPVNIEVKDYGRFDPWHYDTNWKGEALKVKTGNLGYLSVSFEVQFYVPPQRLMGEFQILRGKDGLAESNPAVKSPTYVNFDVYDHNHRIVLSKKVELKYTIGGKSYLKKGLKSGVTVFLNAGGYKTDLWKNAEFTVVPSILVNDTRKATDRDGYTRSFTILRSVILTVLEG